MQGRRKEGACAPERVVYVRGRNMKETDITLGIMDEYNRLLRDAVQSDVLIAGAGPSGLVAALKIAEAGRKVAVIERKLAPGGGIWGGGMFWNVVIVQPEAAHVLALYSIKPKKLDSGLLAVPAAELASAQILHSVRAGAPIFNYLTAEDVMIKDGRVCGLVVNRTQIPGHPIHVDPITLEARVVVDCTGHDACLCNYLTRRGLVLDTESGGVGGEGAMWAEEAERFVVERTSEVFPGLLVAGMSVCAVHGGPRMGPIFGGMLLSGERAAELALSML